MMRGDTSILFLNWDHCIAVFHLAVMALSVSTAVITMLRFSTPRLGKSMFFQDQPLDTMGALLYALLGIYQQKSNTRQITSAEFNQDKRTSTVKFGEPQSGKGVSLNGLMFCIARYSKSDGGKEFGIMSFDFKKEKFETVQFPMPLTDLDSLSVLEGQLCVAVLRSGCQLMKIWRLEDITPHTWIQIYSVTISPASLMFCHLQPILIHQGKILIKSTEGLHYRNLKTGSKMRTIYQDERMHHSQVHVESAVSLAHL